MGLLEVVFPVRHDRPYGLASACFLVLLVFAEVEGLAFTALGIAARRSDLFLELQFAIAPAAFLISLASASALWLQQRAVRARFVRYTSDLSENPDVVAFAERIATHRPD